MFKKLHIINKNYAIWMHNYIKKKYFNGNPNHFLTLIQSKVWLAKESSAEFIVKPGLPSLSKTTLSSRFGFVEQFSSVGVNI